MSMQTAITGKIRILNRVFIRYPILNTTWILVTGMWDDTGIWLDDSLWNDG